jgi:RNA recognition motif-containing protein
MRIFVGNLARDVSEAELQQAFAEFGRVSSVVIPKDRETGEPRGFGFVEMPVDDEAKLAVAGLNGRALKGRALRIDEARPRGERAPAASPRAPYRGQSESAPAARPPVRDATREPEHSANRADSRPSPRSAGRATEWQDAPRPVREDWDAFDERRRSSQDEWSMPVLPLGDDWSSPPRNVDAAGPSSRGSRHSRGTGKRGRDDSYDDERPSKWNRSGGRGRGRRYRYEDDEDIW